MKNEDKNTQEAVLTDEELSGAAGGVVVPITKPGIPLPGQSSDKYFPPFPEKPSRATSK